MNKNKLLCLKCFNTMSIPLDFQRGPTMDMILDCIYGYTSRLLHKGVIKKEELNGVNFPKLISQEVPKNIDLNNIDNYIFYLTLKSCSAIIQNEADKP